jgi:hypothetical protein
VAPRSNMMRSIFRTECARTSESATKVMIRATGGSSLLGKRAGASTNPACHGRLSHPHIRSVIAHGSVCNTFLHRALENAGAGMPRFSNSSTARGLKVADTAAASP